VDAPEVVVHEVQGDGAFYVLDLLAKAIRLARMLIRMATFCRSTWLVPSASLNDSRNCWSWAA
jgi:hypothetical protein